MTTDSSAPWPTKVIIFTDGASRGNPGPASIGVHIISEGGEILGQIAEYIGTETNNVAEYTALVRALEVVRPHGVREITVRADSELMIRQLKGEYRVKAENLRPLFMRCMQLSQSFERVNFEHVRREANKVADGLANQALDLLKLAP